MKISVVTACLNSEKDIEKTIQSVIQQKNCELEYIIVDGGSTDRTLSIINKYKSDIDIIISEKDQGIYDAYNKGLQLATGDAIYILNSDDYFYNNFVLENITTIFEENEQYVAVYGNVLQVNERTEVKRVAGHSISWNTLRRGNMIPHQGLFVKTEIFKKYNYFDDTFRIAGDFDFVAKLVKEYEQQMYYTNQTIAVYKMEGISNTVRGKILMNKEFIEVIQKYSDVEEKAEILKNTDIHREYFKKWVEILLFTPEQCASIVLKQRNIQNVALFGSGELAVYLQKDLEKSNITIHAFLDNNSASHTSLISGIPIYAPIWLQTNSQQIDAVIFAFEGNHDEAIRHQLSTIMTPDTIQMISWKEILDWNQ